MTDFAGLQLAAEAVELHRDLPVIIVAGAANPVAYKTLLRFC